VQLLNKLAKMADPEIRRKNLEAVRLSAREAYWRVRRPAMPDPVFVVGCSRAGTTVTFETLRACSHFVSMPYEVPQLWNGLWGPSHSDWASEAAGAEHAKPSHRVKALAWFYAQLGVGQVLDKTCINVMRIPYLLALFPAARFIYIQRDGRDNISSMMDGWHQHGRFALRQYLGRLPEPVSIEGGEFRDWCFFLPPGWPAYNRASLVEVCAYQWTTANTMALDAAPEVPEDQWVHVRYEDIFNHPVEMFDAIFQRLNLPFEDNVRRRCEALAEHPTSIVSGPPARQKWLGRNRAAIERILPAIEPLMTRLGYEAST